MADTLDFSLPQDMLHPAFNALDLALASRGDGAEGKAEEGFRLKITNAVWGQEGYEFLEAFLDVLAENYGAGVRPMNFAGAPEESRVTINDWVADQTEGRITDLLPEGIIHALTRLVLTNAIYFNAAWDYPFDNGHTARGNFYQLSGRAVDAQMMQEDALFGYAEGDGYQAVELPYDGREMSMTILLPNEGRFGEFEESMNAALLSRILEDTRYRDVVLTMPKFEFESQFSLAQALMAMGMPDAFSRGADFSGMDGCPGCLSVEDVVHKAFVSVDEEGTEAAAATAVVMTGDSLPLPIPVSINRPFIFLIRDIETGVILFIGRVLDPTQ